MKRKQAIESVRWDLALRYRLIETIAWWEGRLTTGHLMQSFGIETNADLVRFAIKQRVITG